MFYCSSQNSQPQKLLNKKVILDWNIPAINGLIHVIDGPLRAPPVPVSGHFCISTMEHFGELESIVESITEGLGELH